MVHADARGDVVGTFGVSRDVTERTARAVEREGLVAAIENSTDEIVITDRALRIVFANQVFALGVGRAASELVGQPIIALARAILEPDVTKAFVDAVRAGKSWVGKFETAPDQAGRRLSVEVSLAPTIDPHGEIVAWIGTIRDITSLRDAELQLERKRTLTLAVAELDRLLLSLSDAVDVAHEACRLMVGTGLIAMAWVGLIDPITRRVVPAPPASAITATWKRSP